MDLAGEGGGAATRARRVCHYVEEGAPPHESHMRLRTPLGPRPPSSERTSSGRGGEGRREVGCRRGVESVPRTREGCRALGR